MIYMYRLIWKICLLLRTWNVAIDLLDALSWTVDLTLRSDHDVTGSAVLSP